MTLRATIVPVTPFVQNCSVVWCDATGRGAVVELYDQIGVELGGRELGEVRVEHARG